MGEGIGLKKKGTQVDGFSLSLYPAASVDVAVSDVNK